MAFSSSGWAFTVQVLNGRWFKLFASFLIMSVNGTTYLFSLYSNNLKSSLGYSETTVLVLSFFKDLGTNVGILPGLINQVTPPVVVLSLGAALNFFGYFMFWLAVTKRMASPQVWHMCLYIFLAANSQPFAETGSLAACVKYFPESLFLVLGLLKGFVGLSGAILTQLYHTIYGEDANGLILLLACLPTAIYIANLRTIRTIKVVRQQPDKLQVFYKFLYISLGLAGFLMIVIILQNKTPFSKFEYGISTAVVLVILFLPLVIYCDQGRI